MFKKTLLTMFLCIVLILQCICVFAQTSEKEEVITEFTTSVPGERFRLFVYSEPEKNIGIEIVNSGGKIPPETNSAEAIMKTFANFGQISTDKVGTGHYDFSIKTPGTYSVRYSQEIHKSLLYVQPEKDFFALTWPSYDTGFYNITNMPLYNLPQKLADNGIEKTVKEVAEYTKDMPRGKKTVYFDLYHFQWFLEQNVEDYLYYDNGAEYLHEMMSEFFKAYKEAGYSFDYLVLDTEEVFWHDAYSNLDASKYMEITQNEKWPEWRQQLEERGFEFCTDPNLGELYYLVDPTGSSVSNLKTIWRVVFFNRMAEYVTYATYDAAVEYFPDIKMGNWENANTDSWYKIPAYGGQAFYNGGNFEKAGTHSTFEAYGEIGYIVDPPPALYNKVRFDGVPFNVMLSAVNRGKATYLSDDEKQMQFWIASSNYRSGIEGLDYTLANTPYYAEQVFHLGMLDPEPFLYFNPVDGVNADKDVHMNEAYKLSLLLEELSAVSPSKNRKTITPDYPNWNKRYLISGMTDGEKNIWRITPDLSVKGVTLENFLVDRNTPTFSIEGRTVEFAEGTILDDIGFNNDTCGYWVETPADVYPVETVDEDLAFISPAISVDFESYADSENNLLIFNPKLVDRGFNATSGHFEINHTDDDVILSLQGGKNTRLDYVHYPQKVNVLGKDKEQQIWEIKVKLPESPAFNTEKFYLFGFDNVHSGSDTSLSYLKDTALCIEDALFGGNTLYCNSNGQRVSIAELETGVWYTIRRKIDFSGDNVISDVDVYKEDGTHLATSKGLIYQTKHFPVYDIMFGTDNYKSNRNVLIDDFKVYLTGFDVELELYDEKTGIPLDEIPADNGLVALVNYNNANLTAVEYVLIYAMYEEDRLSYTKVLSKGEFAAGDDGAICVKLPAVEKSGVTQKLFLWNSIEGLIPLHPGDGVISK